MPLQTEQVVAVTIELDGSDEPLELDVLKSALTTRAARDFQKLLNRAGIREKRVELLTKKAGEVESEEDFERVMADLDRLENQPDQITLATEFAASSIKKWNMFKTAEDKAAGRAIPLTTEALLALDPTLLLGIVGKITDLINPEGEQGKEQRTS